MRDGTAWVLLVCGLLMELAIDLLILACELVMDWGLLACDLLMGLLHTGAGECGYILGGI